MQRRERRTRTVVDDVCVELVCDVCGRKGQRACRYDRETEWDDSSFGVDSITIKRRKGESYPEGSFITAYWLEICPDCFQKHVVEHLQTLGATLYDSSDDD